MKIAEVRELSTTEIAERLENEKAHLLKLRLNHAVSPLDNPNKLSESKKTIARLKTEMRAREIQESQN